MIRWQRPHSMTGVIDEMDRAFRDLAAAPWAAALHAGGFEWGPAVDVYETEDQIVVKSSLPGVQKEDLEVNATEDGLTIHGESKQEEEVKDDNYYRKELRRGTFHRQIPWPASVDPDTVSAKLEDGVLVVRATKIEKAAGGKQITVE
jgi:HSP20 family protein